MALFSTAEIRSELDTDKLFCPDHSSILCSPLHCKGLHEQLMSSERIEAYSQVIIAKTRLNIMFMAMLGLTPSTDQCISSFIDGLSSQDLNSIRNQSLLAQFKIDFEKEVNHHFVNLTKVRMFQTFGIYLASLSNLYQFFGDGNCMGLWTEAECLDFISTRVVDLIDASSFHQPWFTTASSFENLSFKGWKPDQVKELEKLLVEAISPILKTSLALTFLSKWIQYLDARSPATRLLLYSKTTGNFDSWNTRGFTGSFPFKASMQTAWNGYKSGKLEKPWLAGLSADEMGGSRNKIEDESARIKEYHEALEYYDILNFTSTKSPELLHSLVNSAALRLRLSSLEELNHVPLVILECSFALQIDPTHTKALCRRGLALALMKKWDQAIVDFERALELDPNSPAKKELEVARRQVVRRIGN